jgi:hypothetical protein
VADVVILAPDEQVIKVARRLPARKRPHYHRPCISDEDWPAFLTWKAEREKRSTL